MEKLTENEIQKRMTEWRNMKVLHDKAVCQNKKLRKKFRNEEAENNSLRGIVRSQAETIETLRLQMEELRRIVFGRKRKKNKDDEDDDDFRLKPENKKPWERNKDSYKRPVPDEKDVTAHEYHNLPAACPDCGTGLTERETVTFHEEDIPLPDKETKLKRVIQHHTEKGFCPRCRKWHTAIPLPSAKVILGENVKLFIIYLNILLRLSFSQIRSLLWDMYHFRLSGGEIAKILHNKADRLKPESERIKKRLREGRGVHMDETSWGKGLFMWVMSSMDTEEVIYLAGRTRGKGNADELLGNSGVSRLTDAYGAYKNQKGPHQQCWSHPHTKLEQLAYSGALTKEMKEHCRKAYGEFSEIYAKLRGYIKEKFEPVKRAEQKKELSDEILKFRKFYEKDPKKLRNVKQQFHDYADEWLTCMDHDGMPCDNNKAERMLRHFVIKRKISFGNKSAKGHETFGTLASVLMTYWKTYRDSFFAELRILCA